MSEFDILKNMLDRNKAKYVEGIDGEGNKILTIPAFDEEVLILCFNSKDECDWIDADNDWEECLATIEENPNDPSFIPHNILD